MSTGTRYNSLERVVSLQDVRDVPNLSTRRSSTVEGLDGYRYVDCDNRKYRKPPTQFHVTITRIDGNSRQTTCRPGSIFEGNVYIKLTTPLAAEQLKLVFKAAEHIHGGNKKRGQKIFGIKTRLWGGINVQEKWPIMEAGEHQFPFMCKIPMVNYPPSFRHHLASCEFELLASLDRPGIRPFQTVPCSIRYEPCVISPTTNLNEIHKENVQLSQDTKVLVTLCDGRYFNLLDSNQDILKAQVTITQPIGHLEVYLKREVMVTYGTYSQSDTMVMSHADQSSFGIVKKGESTTYFIRLPIPSEISKHNNASILKNFSVLGMTPTLYFSKYIKMEYKLYITAKTKHGLISTKKQVCCIPIYFGTVPSTSSGPTDLVSYSDPSVVSDTSLRTKPRFIKPHVIEEQLPPYEQDWSLPQYQSIVA